MASAAPGGTDLEQTSLVSAECMLTTYVLSCKGHVTHWLKLNVPFLLQPETKPGESVTSSRSREVHMYIERE